MTQKFYYINWIFIRKSIFFIFLLGFVSINIFSAQTSGPVELSLQELHKRAVEGELSRRLQAIREIGRRQSPSSVDILVQIFQRHNPGRSQGEWVARIAAIRVLREYKREGRIVDKALRPLLKLLFYDQNEKIQAEAAITIGYVAKYGRPEDRQYAFNMLKRKTKKITESQHLLALMLIKGLTFLKHPNTIPLLKTFLKRDFILLVKMQAKKAIKDLRKLQNN